MADVSVNKEALETAIEEYRLHVRKGVSYNDIASLTDNLVGEEYTSVSFKTFFNMRNGARAKYESVFSIAKVLGVEPETLILRSGTAISLAHSGTAVNEIHDEVVQALVETLLKGMVSTIGKANLSPDEIYASIAGKFLSGELASEVDSEEARQFFRLSANPARAYRLERNIRKIVERSLPYLRHIRNPVPPDDTWADSFVRLAETVSDEELQELWSQMLGGQFDEKKKFSLKTLRIAQDLSSRQADLFSRFCGLVFSVGNGPADEEASLLSIRLDRGTETYLNMGGLKFGELVELSEYGLVNLNAPNFKAGVGTWFVYLDGSFQLKEEATFQANHLSSVGRELYPLVRPIFSEVYLNAVYSMFANKSGPLRTKGA